MRTQDHLLDIQEVNLSFGPHVILRDVNASITRAEESGEVVCFLGPSGIGKTQLSRIIAGLQAPTSGQVLLAHGKPTGPGLACMVPQNYPLFDYLNVWSNFMVAGKQGQLDPKHAEAKAVILADNFGLNDHLKKYPNELSGGTKQRVAIVRQLMCATKYMVMDEPFSGLDPIMKAKAAEAILTLAKSDTYGVTIVVTHDIRTGLQVADKVWLMGLERGSDGNFIPGARLVDTYDLAERGLAWHPEITWSKEFNDLVAEIEGRFGGLK